MAKKRRKSDQFNLDEVYRQLRTNIEFSAMDEKIQVVNIVSANPNEGKSTVATNLARICTAKYNSVLIVDCDLRNSSVHKMYGISNSKGLSNLLSHYDRTTPIKSYEEIKQVSFPDTGRNLFVLTAGSRVPNPSELLGSRRFNDFLVQARKEFDFIVLDCPPYAAVSDAIPLCNASDGTLFVVSSLDTDKRQAKGIASDLKRNGANIIGVILTKVENFHSNHYYYYGYGYGERENK